MTFSTKCKDYFIIRLRYYADKHILDKWHSTDGAPTPKQHWNRAQEINRFFRAFFEQATNTTYTSFISEYMISTRECMIEELSTKYNIVISDGEVWKTWFIPKENTELIQWVLDNVTLPYTTPSKTGTHKLEYRENSSYWRDESREETIKFKKEHTNLNEK